MTDRERIAADLRAAAHRRIADAVRMYAEADRLDPPPPPSPGARRVICPDCGTEYTCPEYFPGCACETRGCDGYLTAMPGPCSCDMEADEELTDRAGVPLGISRLELAAGMAASQFRRES